MLGSFEKLYKLSDYLNKCASKIPEYAKDSVYTSIPYFTWVSDLKPAQLVWLLKEEVFAMVESEYKFTNPKEKFGTIDICVPPTATTPLAGGWHQKWQIRPDGTGLDDKQLFWPVKGEFRDIPTDINFLEKNKDNINWTFISQYYQLNKETILKFKNYVNWYCILNYQKLPLVDKTELLNMRHKIVKESYKALTINDLQPIV